ncbi:MAG: AAA family ATPase, partial [Lachnospiraceae bacterium]|nr:AAA family ATPase [Lachnospiraceae bacterium]
MARKAGFEADSRFRISSAILYTLELAAGEGSLFLPRDILVRRTAGLLGLDGAQAPYYTEDPENAYVYEDLEYAAPVLLPQALRGADDPVESALLDLSVDRKIILKREEDTERVYTTQAYYTELRVARMLKELNLTADADMEQVRAIAVEAAAGSGNELDEIQMQAVLEAMGHTLMILTGGPGTGKTTTINTMISVFERMGLKIELAAPTGRAAKRMKEATGREARTIHRLLEVSGDPDSRIYFNRDADEPLETDVIIIDEMSMVDIYLFQSLLRAVVPGTRLIMVGDANQLPSVGPGSVLKD